MYIQLLQVRPTKFKFQLSLFFIIFIIIILFFVLISVNFNHQLVVLYIAKGTISTIYVHTFKLYMSAIAMRISVFFPNKNLSFSIFIPNYYPKLKVYVNIHTQGNRNMLFIYIATNSICVQVIKRYLWQFLLHHNSHLPLSFDPIKNNLCIMLFTLLFIMRISIFKFCTLCGFYTSMYNKKSIVLLFWIYYVSYFNYKSSKCEIKWRRKRRVKWSEVQ